jgi:chaperone required for assembly of F1-ATPase
MSQNIPKASAADALYRPKRFWTAVSVAPLEAGFVVTLDARNARTPGGKPLVLPTDALARLVAAEWESVDEYLEVGHMPGTRLAFTTLDRVAETREAVAAETARYAGSDLLCYFADEPAALLERQARAWGPVLDWAESELGLKFVRTSGIIHQAQPRETLELAEALASRLDDFQLSALSWGAALFGSAVLALALQRGRLSADEAFDLSRLDETFQAEQWGVDEEAVEREAKLREEARLLERWFRALKA